MFVAENKCLPLSHPYGDSAGDMQVSFNWLASSLYQSKQDQGDQCQSPGFYCYLDLIVKETFRFCNISVMLTFQFW